jgi:hypothetical protein
MPLNWAICNQDVGSIALQRRAFMAPDDGDQAGQPPSHPQRQDTTMSRNDPPRQQRSRQDQVRNVTLGAVVSGLVRFVFEKLCDLI